MIYTAYRRSPTETGAWHNTNEYEEAYGNFELGYLTYDPDEPRTTRYTPQREQIDTWDGQQSWRTVEEFKDWVTKHSDTWSLNHADCYFNMDPDLEVDKGL